MPNKMIAYEIAKHFLLIIFDEYGTSKNCPIPTCDGLMVDKSRRGGNRVRVCSVCELECERDNSACQSGLGILSTTTSGKKKNGKVKVNPDLWVKKFLRCLNEKNSKSTAKSTETKKRKGGVSKKQADKKKKKKKKQVDNFDDLDDFTPDSQARFKSDQERIMEEKKKRRVM